MRILFLHDNFPAQFGLLGQHLARKGWDVTFGTQRKGAAMQGIKVFNYAPHREVTANIHPYVGGFEKAVLAGQGLARAALDLKKSGRRPDIVMAHSGWGPGLFAKDIWPDAKYVGYFEWYYRHDSPDVVFESGDAQPLDDRLRARVRNAAIHSDLVACDAGLCPTEFQKRQFPDCFADKIKVLHDGVDTDYFQPDPGAKLVLPGLDLSGAAEIITYVARGMEPYRGFPEFMQALALVLKKRPEAHAVIVGDDRVAYGKKLPEGDSYRKRAEREIDLDWRRVHFTGLLPRAHYRQVLLASSVHVYLTIPFVLSWSLMEAMSAGCAIVASDVEPVREMAGERGERMALVDMKDPAAVAAAIERALIDRGFAQTQGRAAREAILARYAAEDIYAAKEAWLRAL